MDKTFSDISVMIVTMMALVAIIFAQYYDKTAERSREILWTVRQRYASNNDIDFARDSFCKLAFVGGMRRQFYITFWMFTSVSSILALLWVYNFVGEINEKKSFDGSMTVGIVLSLFIILLGTLIGVFASLNDHKYSLKITTTGFRLKSAHNILSSRFGMDINTFFSDFLSPSLTIVTDQSVSGIIFQHRVPANGYRILWEIHTVNNARYLFKGIPNDSNQFALEHNVSGTGQLSRLQYDLSEVDFQESRIYVQIRGIKKTFIGKVTSQLSSDSIHFNCHSFTYSTPSKKAKSLLKSRTALICCDALGSSRKYRLGKHDERHRLGLPDYSTNSLPNSQGM